VSTNPVEDRIYLEKPDTAFLTKAEIATWEEGKTFSTDWAAGHFFEWAELLHPLRQKVLRILEIGSWEGRSANFFLRYLPRSCVVCIDTFEGNVEHHRDPDFAKRVPEAEEKFDRNLAELMERVEKIKGTSATVLPKLGVARRRFDLAYIDGSHLAADVYNDATLTWPLMQAGGIVIFDDYEWNVEGEEWEQPKLGIEAFLAAISGHYQELYRGFQLVIGKTG
jgi:predicted O-methyltransferase YrrM